MALKDWKKVRNISSKSRTVYVKEFQSLQLEILSPSHFHTDTVYKVYVYDKMMRIVQNFFKTKSAALKFAKSYMRTH